MLKKFLAISLALVILLSFAACSNKDDNDASQRPTTSSQSPTTSSTSENNTDTLAEIKNAYTAYVAQMAELGLDYKEMNQYLYEKDGQCYMINSSGKVMETNLSDYDTVRFGQYGTWTIHGIVEQ